MTIDEAITEVQQQKLDYQEFWEEYKNEHIEALDMAINTMHKYQKIEQIIMDDWDKGYQHSETIQRIKEVIKNGNNNTNGKKLC